MRAARRRHAIAHDGLATGGSVALIFDEEHILDQVARGGGGGGGGSWQWPPDGEGGLLLDLFGPGAMARFRSWTSLVPSAS